jgi:hypothetical protein
MTYKLLKDIKWVKAWTEFWYDQWVVLPIWISMFSEEAKNITCLIESLWIDNTEYFKTNT